MSSFSKETNLEKSVWRKGVSLLTVKVKLNQSGKKLRGREAQRHKISLRGCIECMNLPKNFLSVPEHTCSGTFLTLQATENPNSY